MIYHRESSWVTFIREAVLFSYPWRGRHPSCRFVFINNPVEAECDFNKLRPGQDGRLFADDIFKCIFLNENAWISIKISLKLVHNGPISNTPALVQIMAWRRPGDKPLSESIMVSLLTYICVARPQWFNPNGTEGRSIFGRIWLNHLRFENWCKITNIWFSHFFKRIQNFRG